MKYFEGTPIPTSLVLVMVMAALFSMGRVGRYTFLGGHVELLWRGFHPFSVLFLISGSLMISTIRVPKP